MAQLVDPSPVSAQRADAPIQAIMLDMEEVLGSPKRVWLRGQLIGVPRPAVRGPAEGNSWWTRRRAAPPQSLQSTALLEARIGTRLLTAEVALDGDGRFAAVIDTELPPAKKGWRIARNRVTYLGQTAEKCSLVASPPEQTRSATVVILPPPIDETPDSKPLLSSVTCQGLINVIGKQTKTGSRANSIYYVMVVPTANPSNRARIALAMTSMGWPHGSLVLLSGDETRSVRQILAEGIDRLRWLHAGSLDLVVASADRAAVYDLRECLEPAPNRAIVSEFVNVDAESPAAGRWIDASRTPSPAVLRPSRAAHIPHFPIVFCHGMLGLSTLYGRLPENLNYFSPLADFLSQRGFRALYPQVPPTSGVADRAALLKEQILRWTEEPINIVAHSMGGLDARYMISRLDMAKRVRSLTTVATPHRGTYLVEWFLTNYHSRVPLLRGFEMAGVSLDGFRACRRDDCREFNASTPNAPGVTYFSYAGVVPASRVTPFLRRAWSILTPVEGPNDGMVPAASARWGEYLGTLHADHFAQTPDMTLVRPDEDFDAAGFYCRVIEDLARRGL
jgi:triacylglycerol lipase